MRTTDVWSHPAGGGRNTHFFPKHQSSTYFPGLARTCHKGMNACTPLLLLRRYADVLINYFQDVASTLITRAAMAAASTPAAAAPSSGRPLPSATAALNQRQQQQGQPGRKPAGGGGGTPASGGPSPWEGSTWSAQGAHTAGELVTATGGTNEEGADALYTVHAMCQVEGAMGVTYPVRGRCGKV